MEIVCVSACPGKRGVFLCGRVFEKGNLTSIHARF